MKWGKGNLSEKQKKAILKYDKIYHVFDKKFICRCDDLKTGKAIYCYRHKRAVKNKGVK